MRRIFLSLLIAVMVGLSGCSPAAQTTPTSIPTTEATAQQAPTLIVNIPTAPPTASYNGCTAVSKEPTPGPTAESAFPPVSDQDWVKGPASAKVTIIEYSDFQ